MQEDHVNEYTIPSQLPKKLVVNEESSEHEPGILGALFLAKLALNNEHVSQEDNHEIIFNNKFFYRYESERPDKLSAYFIFGMFIGVLAAILLLF